MELRHLRHFIVVAEEEHFGRAAKRLAIVQPALTRQVHQIERELGVSLFDRVGRGVRLTDAGRIFMQDARRAVAEVERAGRRAQLAAQGQIGTLAVSFSCIHHSSTVPTVLAEFKKQTPELQLELLQLGATKQWAALRDRRISASFLYFLPTEFPELRSEALAQERVVLAIPKGHRLAVKPRILLHDLHDEPFVWFPRTLVDPYVDHVNQACMAGGLVMNVAQEAPNGATHLALVAQGVGVCFTLASSVRQKMSSDVLLREVADLDLTLTLRVAWRADDPSSMLPRFLEVVRDVHAKLPNRSRDVA